MRYVAFLLLLLLSLYFLFLKPYLREKDIEYKIKGVSFTLSPLSVRVSSFYLYFPLGQGRYFFSVKGLNFRLDGVPKLRIEEGIFTIVPDRKGSDGKVTIPKLAIPEVIKRSNVEVNKLLINLVSQRKISVLVEGLELKDRKLNAFVSITYGNITADVDLGEAYLGREEISLGELSARSRLFYLRAEGVYREGMGKGEFSIEGWVNPIEDKYVRIYPIEVKGKGTVDYKYLTAELTAHTPEIYVKGRKRFKEVWSRSLFQLRFGEFMTLIGDIESGDVKGRYRLELSPRRRLRVEIESFPVDSELLRTSRLIFGWVRGDLSYTFGEKRLRLNLFSNNLLFEDLSFQETDLNLEYDFKASKGMLDLRAYGAGSVALQATLEGSNLKGRLFIKDMFLIRDGVSAFLSYGGYIDYAGKVSLKGRGEIKSLHYRDFPVGDLSYTLSLTGKDIYVSYKGKGVEGFLKGKIGRELFSVNDLIGFKRGYRGTDIEVKEGRVDLFVYGKSLSISAKLVRGKISRGNLRSEFKGDLKVIKKRDLRGEFNLEGSLFSAGKILGKGYLKGKVKGVSVIGSYGFGNYIGGSYSFNIERGFLSTEGRIRRKEIELSYLFKGSSQEGRALFEGDLKFYGERIPFKGSVSYRGETYLLKLEPLEYQLKTAQINLGGLSVKGSFEKAKVDLKPLELRILGESIFTLLPNTGELSLKRRQLDLKGNLEGSIRGSLKLLYGGGRFKLESSGSLDLERLSFFTATPLGGRSRGTLSYTLKFDEGGLRLELKNEGRVLIFSRYFSVPMDLWVELRALGRSLAAFLTAWKNNSGFSANVGSNDLRNYYVYLVSRDLPVSYRGSGVLSSLKVSSEGWIKVNDLKEVSINLSALLSGDIEIETLEKGRRAKKGIPVNLNVRFESSDPIRISMPEGYVYANIKGWVSGRADSPEYVIRVEFLSGELRYFGREFFVKGGTLNLVREKDREERVIDLSIVNPTDEISIFINLRGDLEDPSIVVWSEPPRSTQEIMTNLIIGSTAEGIIPVAKALFKQLGYIGEVRGGLASLLGVDITLSTQTGSQGEVGFGVNVRKKIARAFTVEYQQSTLKDPRQTYYGGSVHLPANLSFYGRMFSDKTSEIKLRFIRKFDF